MSALSVLKRNGEPHRQIDDDSMQFDTHGLSIGDDDFDEVKPRYNSTLASPRRIHNKKYQYFKPKQQEDELQGNYNKIK